MGEQELAKTGVAGTILRFSIILGEEGGTLDLLDRTAAFGPVIVIPGNGKAQIQPILREDAARIIVETIGRADLLGKIIELGGPEVMAMETIYDWYLQARGIKKRKLHVMPELLIPGAIVMETLMDNPLVTPDEIRTIQLPNLAEGMDSVSVRYGWRPTAPSTWALNAWKKKPVR
jgi:NADH dehydrogenase